MSRQYRIPATGGFSPQAQTFLSLGDGDPRDPRTELIHDITPCLPEPVELVHLGVPTTPPSRLVDPAIVNLVRDELYRAVF